LRSSPINLLKACKEAFVEGFVNDRYNSCANRCYYACFQAAIAALLREGIQPAGQWHHQFVQAQFVGVLINQRKRYDPQLRRVLADNQSLRDKADYRSELVTATRQRGGVVQWDKITPSTLHHVWRKLFTN
jgi:uncharacterized protein (UPF0332 family)